MAPSQKKHVIILHGSYGRPASNWFPWLAECIQSSGHLASVPTFPTPTGQSLTAWLRVFREQVGALTPETLLIGHSMGCGFALRLLEESPCRITGTLLAAGFIGALGLPDYDSMNASFFSRPFDWQTIRHNSGRVHIYAGEGDPYVPLEYTNEMALRLASTPTVIERGGHLNDETGFVVFPQLLEDLRPLLAL